MLDMVQFSSRNLNGVGVVISRSPILSVEVVECNNPLKVGKLVVLDPRTTHVVSIPQVNQEEHLTRIAEGLQQRAPNTLREKTTAHRDSQVPHLLNEVVRAGERRAPDLSKFAHIGMDLYREKAPPHAVWVLETEASEDGHPRQWLSRLIDDDTPLRVTAARQTTADTFAPATDQITPMSWVNTQSAQSPEKELTLEEVATPSSAQQTAEQKAQLIFTIDPNDVARVEILDGKMIIHFYEEEEAGAAPLPPPTNPHEGKSQQPAQPAQPGAAGTPLQGPLATPTSTPLNTGMIPNTSTNF